LPQSAALCARKGMSKYLVSVFLLLTSVNVFAVNDFKCTIKDAVNLEADGSLNHKSYLVSGYIGKEFVVNRQTGIITGANITNTMSGKMPAVYDYLPNENGYKAVTHYKPNNIIDYLQINQYADKPEKPFFYKGAFGTMVSGTCVVY
jgi:hypothetical protein